MTRAMQIAVGANKGTTISLAGVATSQEIVTMTWHAQQLQKRIDQKRIQDAQMAGRLTNG